MAQSCMDVFLCCLIYSIAIDRVVCLAVLFKRLTSLRINQIICSDVVIIYYIITLSIRSTIDHENK